MKFSAFILLNIMVFSCAAPLWPTDEYIKKNNYLAVDPTIDGNTDYAMLDKYPMYPNGERGILDLILQNLSYPEEAREKGIMGKVLVEYVVGSDGFVTDIKVIESAHPLLDNEAVRIIKLMKRWIPGYFKGQPINVQFKQPFNFTIQ